MKLGRTLRNDRRIRSVLRRDLDRYAEHATVGYDADRGLERLTASLAVASAVGGAAIATTGLKGLAAKALTLPGLKVLALCFLVGAVGTAAAARIAQVEARPVRPAAPALASPASSPAPASARREVVVPLPVPPPARAEPKRFVPESAEGTRVREERIPSVSPRVAQGTARAEPPAPPPAEPPAALPAETPPAPLREQMAALARLREVAASDPAAAVSLAAADDARFGKGDLYAEEREAIAVVALAQSGRLDEARAKGARFLSAYPKSPFGARVRGALAP
jgi:hypothetical protein